MRSKARGKASRIRPATLEYAHYLIVMTNLPPEDLSVAGVLEFYRARWQVELAFKRLKTLLELGQLPKKKEASSLAWMQGKILCAILIERLLCEARFISPWGYPVGRTEPVELV
jgi:transposase